MIYLEPASQSFHWWWIPQFIVGVLAVYRGLYWLLYGREAARGAVWLIAGVIVFGHAGYLVIDWLTDPSRVSWSEHGSPDEGISKLRLRNEEAADGTQVYDLGTPLDSRRHNLHNNSTIA